MPWYWTGAGVAAGAAGVAGAAGAAGAAGGGVGVAGAAAGAAGSDGVAAGAPPGAPFSPSKYRRKGRSNAGRNCGPRVRVLGMVSLLLVDALTPCGERRVRTAPADVQGRQRARSVWGGAQVRLAGMSAA
ncbi:hypothetical protein C1632_02505 [Microbacterium testaceum]|nr:hypothetical protein C1632_02505 [Microbacterium testaceum]